MQGDIDGIGLGDCMQNTKADVHLLSSSLVLAVDLAMMSTMRLDVAAFTTTHRKPILPRWEPFLRRDPSPMSEPDITDYYNPKMY